MKVASAVFLWEPLPTVAVLLLIAVIAMLVVDLPKFRIPKVLWQ